MAGLDQLWEEEVCEQPVADVVSGEVHLDAVLADGTLGEAADTGAVDQDIEFGDVRPGEELGGASTDGLLAAEVDVEGAVVDVGVFVLEGVDALLQLGGIAPGDDEVGGGLRGLYSVLVRVLRQVALGRL